MSSPPKYRTTFSPIRNLQERFSPTRKLDIILQESLSSKLSPRQQIGFQRSPPKYFTNRYSNPIQTTNHLLIQNNRLRTDNQILSSSRRANSIALGQQFILQQKQVSDLQDQLNLVSDRYQKQNLTLRIQNENLKKTIILLQTKKSEQIYLLKEKYSMIPQTQREIMKKTYNDDINKLLIDLQTTHMLLEQKQKQLEHLSILVNQNSKQYGMNLQKLISDNNVLKSQILQLQLKTQKQLRQVNTRKQLQKSRTQGIISYCKQNTLYIQKQINRLADQLLTKNISIQSFHRQITKYQRLIQQQSKRSTDQIYKIKKQTEQKLNQQNKTFNKIQKQFKQDLNQKKKREFQLIQEISGLENQIDVLNKKLTYAEQTITDKEKIIKQLKYSINRKQEDHAKQISKVMSQSKVKRKSMKNLSSYSSIKDIQQIHQGSSIMKSGNLRRVQSIGIQQASSPLPIVRQQQNLAQSQTFPGLSNGQDQFDIRQLVLHYQSMVQQLKKNKITQLSIANNKIQSLKQSLNQKQQEVLDILNRFSPLMEYSVNQESIDEERRRRIQEHQKGDVDLLGVMLSKYDIVSLRTSRK